MDANDEINKQPEKQNNDTSQLPVVVNQPTTKPKYTKEQINKINETVKQELLKINKIKDFIIKDSQQKIELQVFENEFSFDFDFDEKIVAIYKYNLTLSKLKTFSQVVLVNFYKPPDVFKQSIQFYLEVRKEIFLFSNHFFKKSVYFDKLMEIQKLNLQTKQFLLKNFKIESILNYVVNLTNIINEMLKNNLIEKLQRKQVNHFISKLIFYTTFIMLFK